MVVAPFVVLATERIPHDLPLLLLAGQPNFIERGVHYLLPQSSVDLLGIEANADEVYELQGFDGNISISKAVRVDLVFGRKTFKGRFLLIDQAWGILGRDVLNHVCLILDGPQQAWEER
jgi:hypothetical protein